MRVCDTQFVPPPLNSTETAAAPAIEASGLSKSYGARRVLDAVNIKIERGGVLALLGPNGAGKTTTVRILATLLEPDAGQARVAGHDVVTERRQVRSRISLTGQYAALDDIQTGRENLEIVGRLLALPARRARARADELLERFDLAEAADRRVGSYSGGMRRRLDLAAGLIGHPEVVFLDEPSTGLDLRSRQALWQIVRDLTAEGVTVLLTTQYLEEADALADRIAVLDDGQLVAEGSATELKRRIAGERLDIQFTDPDAYADAIRQLDGRALRREPGDLIVGTPVSGGATEIRRLLDELDPQRERIADFSLHQASLDDVFLALTGHGTSTHPEPDTDHE
jgi:ABC-2 type transport system ATP-binding protein